MCGIAGIIGRLSDSNRGALRRMNDALRHRGPDGEGYWESPPGAAGQGVMLAHRRLAILDLSNAASQPMCDPVFGHVIVLNGEIYNYVELRNRLRAAGHRFESSGDTAVMLRALCEGGTDAIGQLRGMFAFAYWNSAERSLCLARDPLGIKPLYVARPRSASGEWSLAFASEVRALLASGLIEKPVLDAGAVASIVWQGFAIAPNTAIDQVESLMPGEWQAFDEHGTEVGRRDYAAARKAPPPNGLGEPDIEAALEESVRLHLASDVPLGIFLSGGIDSSAIANLAQRTAGTRVKTFTLAFDEPEYNEGKIARQVAEAIGTEHQEVLLTEQRFIAELEAALDSLDQPTFDGLNSYYMSHAVREGGFTVALVGSGGDELFGGYVSFRDLPSVMRWSSLSGWAPAGLKSGLSQLVSGALHGRSRDFPPQTRWAKVGDFLAEKGDPLTSYQLAYALFRPSTQRQMLRPDLSDAVSDGLSARMRALLRSEIDGRSPLSGISVLERRLFLGERLLRDTDAASMSASIEIRLPLVDEALVNSVDRLDDRTRFQPVGRKSLLRRIGLRGLSPALFDRPKSGFVLPYNRWLKGRLGRVVDCMMRDSDAASRVGLNPLEVQRLWEAYLRGSPGLYWSRVWAIYVLMRWCDRHGVHL